MAAGPRIRQRYNSSKVLKQSSLLGHIFSRNTLAGSCGNLAKSHRFLVSYKSNFNQRRIIILGQLKLIYFLVTTARKNSGGVHIGVPPYIFP